jgi:adenylate kinase family enzyme
MSLVLEGADNSGKTTLAKDLRQLNPKLKYFHSGSAPRDADHESMCLLHQYEKCAQPNMIIDRVTCISQQVYGNRIFEHTLMQELDKLLRIGTIIIYCRPSTDRLMSFEKFTWRDEESEEYKQQVIKNQHEYIDRYDKVMASIPHIMYDFDEETPAAWLRQMFSEAAFDQITFMRLQDVMFNSNLWRVRV